MPSKLWIGAESGPTPFFDCTRGSLTVLAGAFGCKASLSRAVMLDTTATGSSGSALTAGEVPSYAPVPTCGPDEAAPRTPLACVAR